MTNCTLQRPPRHTYEERHLIYSAYSRCPCGAGLAYVPLAYLGDEFPHWDCSTILLGTADPRVEHCPEYPFAFHTIVAEDSMKAYGRSTRPTEPGSYRLEWGQYRRESEIIVGMVVIIVLLVSFFMFGGWTDIGGGH